MESSHLVFLYLVLLIPSILAWNQVYPQYYPSQANCCGSYYQAGCCQGPYQMPPACCGNGNVQIQNNAVQPGLLRGSSGQHLAINSFVAPVLPGYSKTFHYQYVPQPAQVVLPHYRYPVIPPVSIPTFPTWKPFNLTFPTMAPLPTFKPFVFPTFKTLVLPTQKPVTPQPLRFELFKPPTFPPMMVPALPTMAPARFGYVTFPPMKVMLPPQLPPMKYYDHHWPTFPPMKIPIFPTPEPVKFQEFHWPTLAPWKIAVPDTRPRPPKVPLEIEPVPKNAEVHNGTSVDEHDCD